MAGDQGRPAHRAAYIAFDRFPSTKGSAVHIQHMAAELFARFDGGLLCVLGGPGLPRYQREGGIEAARFDLAVPNLLDRAEAFSHWVAAHLEPHLGTLELYHVRDPWGALPALAAPQPAEATGPGASEIAGPGASEIAGPGASEIAGPGARRRRLVYEVNGLPSVELPHTWPLVAPSTLEKLRLIERRCLLAADAVVVPSAVIAAAVTDRGAPSERVHLVPNGADLPPADLPCPAGAPARYLAYVGALQPWQGLDVLLQAMARLADLDDLHLVVCSSVPESRARALQRLARRLGVAERVRWHFAVPHREVAAWLAHAELAVAPLTGCARNLDQGCSPLKVWEAMAAGVPVVASDLPAVRELVTDGEHGLLVHPDRPAELARAVRVLLEYPEVGRAMGERARRRIAQGYTWAHARSRLAEVYDAVLSTSPQPARGAPGDASYEIGSVG